MCFHIRSVLSLEGEESAFDAREFMKKSRDHGIRPYFNTRREVA